MSILQVSTPRRTGASVESSDLIAKYFRALGDPTRLRILRLLLRGERSVGDLVDELDLAQSRVSNHLTCLRWCGLVSTRGDGKRIYYALADARIAEMIRLAQSMVALHAEQVASCAIIED